MKINKKQTKFKAFELLVVLWFCLSTLFLMLVSVTVFNLNSNNNMA